MTWLWLLFLVREWDCVCDDVLVCLSVNTAQRQGVRLVCVVDFVGAMVV